MVVHYGGACAIVQKRERVQIRAVSGYRAVTGLRAVSDYRAVSEYCGVPDSSFGGGGTGSNSHAVKFTVDKTFSNQSVGRAGGALTPV